MGDVTPYFADELVTLYLGDCREVLPALDLQADCFVADPPYGETSLKWDRWPDGWLDVAATVTRSLWCFGTLRMYLDHAAEFRAARWKLSQDVIWEKHNGSGFANDRFKRVHEQPTHWFRGAWSGVYHEAPTTPDAIRHQMRRKARPTHTGDIGAASYLSEDGGPRLMRSVIYMPSMHGKAIHPTEKPSDLIEILIRTSCPPGGVVGDMFAGSGAAGEAAMRAGRNYVGCEIDEAMANRASSRLDQLLPIMSL